MASNTLQPPQVLCHGQRKAQKKNGRVERDPKSGTIIWISTQGTVKWEAPPTEEFITFEERSTGAQHIDPWIRDFETVQEARWKRFRHGLVTESLGSQHAIALEDLTGEGATSEIVPDEEIAMKDP